MSGEYAQVLRWRTRFPDLTWDEYLAMPPAVMEAACLVEDALGMARTWWRESHG